MAEPSWSLQDAKNRFSAVVNAAREGTPQRVTRRGKQAVVVIAVEEYERLQRAAQSLAPDFTQHLLAMPQDDGAFDRLPVALRDVEL